MKVSRPKLKRVLDRAHMRSLLTKGYLNWDDITAAVMRYLEHLK
jgi:hypothetical protein